MRTSTYDQDFYAWTQAQAAALRAARPNRFDWEHIALELEATGRNEWDQMESRIRQILIHLLKWQFQPWMRSRSWRNSLWVQRRDLAKLLRRNPSLRGHVEEALAEEYPAAIVGALDETDRPARRRVPHELPLLSRAAPGSGVSTGLTAARWHAFKPLCHAPAGNSLPTCLFPIKNLLPSGMLSWRSAGGQLPG